MVFYDKKKEKIVRHTKTRKHQIFVRKGRNVDKKNKNQNKTFAILYKKKKKMTSQMILKNWHLNKVFHNIQIGKNLEGYQMK